MADYCTVQQAKDMLGGIFGANSATGSGSDRDSIFADLVTRCSRMFDLETGRGTNFWAPGTGIAKYYSGSGNTTLDIDDFDAVTTVVMSSTQDRSGAVTLTQVYGTATAGNYYLVQPTWGPPYTQLFLLRGWIPDAFNVGNIAVIGNVSTPSPITHAVAVWAAYEWRAKEAGWQDAAARPDGPGLLYVKGIPPETSRIIQKYKDERRGPKLAAEDGTDRGRRSPWLSWLTTP